MRPSSSEPHHHHRRAAARPANRQEWVLRGSAPSAGVPGPEPTPIPNPRSDHRVRANPNPRSDRRGSASRPPPPSSAPPPPAADSTPDPAAVPQLVQEIQDKLAKGTVECMICYDMVRRSAQIWSCSSCFSIFHLICIRKWAGSPTSADVAAPNSGGTWRCPGCQSPQPTQDLAYTCFCGSRRDPPYDLYLTPHTCGEPCRKPLNRDLLSDDTNRCPHICVIPCHPGPCPPCKAFTPRRPCPCGKTMSVRRCSDRTTPLTCGQHCGRILSCGRHRCDLICHAPPCPPCRAPLTASCFCKNKTETLLCGEIGDVELPEGVFSCKAACGRKLGCGNHSCVENCHPGLCGECELAPERIETCHCGKTLLNERRESCLDRIPTCSLLCEKLLPCGIHRCTDTCHEGDCGPCTALVEQKCRCGSSRRTVECYKTLKERHELFMCDKACGQKKNCGRHRCSERCCPLSKLGGQLSPGDYDPHLCSISCGKKLRCGQHSCQLLCHSGHCPPCLETIFFDLTCACGETSIPPPLPCGTPNPSCPRPCLTPQPCGHSMSHTCHFGDCPPCSIPVPKQCIGGHMLLRNIPCNSKDIRCNQLCGKTRQCGMHACAMTCHSPPCDSGSGSGAKSSCGQVCGAPRRECKHTCTAACHPSSSCPDLRCEFLVTIACSCGRITAGVPCGAGSGSHVDAVFEAAVAQKLPVPLQPSEANGKKLPLGQRKLTCDDECAKLERKRVLAEAFDVAPPNADLESDCLADLFRRESKWVLAVEERLKFLVTGKSKGNTLRVHVFSITSKEKRDAVRQIAEKWKLSVQAAGWEPKRFLVVHVTPKSKPPARILGCKPGIPVTTPLHPPTFDPLVDMDPRLVVAMLDLPRDADISALVLRFGGECELVWLNDKNALAVFGDPARAATALRRLDHGSAYQGAVVIGVGPALKINEGGLSAGKSNPWKKALASESDTWGGEWSSAVVPVWKGNDTVPISASTNPWNVLDHPEAAVNDESVEGHTSRVSEGSAGKVMMIQEVDDWEEACE